mmetsp:Transcript_2203/g.7711  ORF Transcript_2203/g.7711 Transcript_2203/m.7711 type:complete len:224 (-) Transcript_2203:1144-1815(-)
MYSFALGWSSWPPMVVSSLHRASTSSSSGCFMSPSSFKMHVCIIFSVSIDFLYSSPMKRMLPSMRLRASRSLFSFRSLMSAFSSSVSSFFGASSFFSAPSALSSPSASFSSPSLASSSLASCRSSVVASLAASRIAVSPFSNSSWHLFSSTRLKVIFCPLVAEGSSNSTPVSTRFWARSEQRVAYSSQNVGSSSAFSNSCRISPMRVSAVSMPFSMIFCSSLS